MKFIFRNFMKFNEIHRVFADQKDSVEKMVVMEPEV